MTLNLRTILIFLFLIVSLPLAVVMAMLAVSSVKNYHSYSEVASLVSLDRNMFEALINFRAERGNSAAALIQSSAAGTVSRQSANAARTQIDAAMQRFTTEAATVSNASITPHVQRAIDAYDALKALRSRVDANLSRDLAQREPALRDEVLNFGNEVLAVFDETSTALESRVRTLDQSLTGLIEMRAYAWAARNNGGTSAVTITSLIGASRALTSDERATLLKTDSATGFAWKAVGGLVAHESTPADIKAKYAAGSSAYFDGAFNDKREALLRDLAAGPSTVFTVDDWQMTSNAALGVVAQVALAAMAELDETAAQMRSTATMNAVLMSLGAILALATGLGGTAIIVIRVIRPIRALTDCMVALSHGNSGINVPGFGRADEIGEMAGSVEVFRQASIRNGQLEQEAEANRIRAENDRIEMQRVSEEDADRRLNQATAALAEGLKLLATGNMLCEIELPFDPQFEALRHDFNASVKQLRTTLSEFERSVTTVSSGASEISAASNDLARRTEQQAASLEETAAALEQITANVKSTSHRASDAREVVRNVKVKADQSGTVVQNATAAMARIEQSSQQIGQIIGVIDEIAFQTNLLALNAGVEAARAGEAGKGFAVVAQEVRELAQRSAAAAKEIKQLIATSEIAVGEGVSLVDSTGACLTDIETLVRAANEHMEAIAIAAQEQSSGLTQVNAAINHLDQTTQQNAAMVEEMSAAGSGLASECVALDGYLSKFTLAARTEQQPYAPLSMSASQGRRLVA
ncbi:methyl-accepting chemotaxis protein [Neorhizobium sp. JUb45]|uniref:methyl-accepting chemotaxis protein n=1 Tax=Neorhizobium sp. JUb45 TaxID=2485113 RepID=UPI0010F293A5|nr:methyl-accepting chemotaxis protein [Neorhizobium sp. JUb45]TCQ97331.1 methyl-accepting chemotaxis protein [Neorhizobium sp. JUb45]